jgi:transposase
MKKIVFGIDISSKTLDICKKEAGKNEFYTIENEVSAIKKFFKKQIVQNAEILVGMENTGRYNWNLYEVLESFDFKIYVINPLHLKKSLGLVRGKNDKIDAERIAWFTEKNQEELLVWKPSSEVMKKIKVLFSERNSKVKLKAALLKQRQNYTQTKSLKLDKQLLKLNEKETKMLSEHIAFLENEIENLINSDEDLRGKKETIQSIPGVGKVLSWMMIAKTEGFTKINEARKMACYAGVVPFENQSGTSLRHKPKVSYFADKSLKSVLHLAAMSAIRLENDLRVYYQRKVKEGKNKMLVLNAVRNKIIHRIFALIKTGKSYEKNYKNNLILS